MTEYLLSIIIPVYKVENYIEACLDSVFSQIDNLVEIIVINDGTPDRSIEIIKSKYEDWLNKDKVILLEQENAGPGAARNYGLSVARGKYIAFLDSDDVVLDNYFSTIIETIGEFKTDVIEFGFQRFQKLSDIKNDNYFPLYRFKGIQKLTEVRNHIFSVGVWFPWTRVYKKAVFENTQFPVGVFYEDLMTIPHIYLKNLEVYFIDKPLIGYRFNPNSTTALHSKPHARDMYTFYRSLAKLNRSIPIEIIRIKTARSITYFYNELGSLEVPVTDVIRDIKKIKKRLGLLKSLKFPDLFFFLLPKVYMWVDKIRLKRVKRQLK